MLGIIFSVITRALRFNRRRTFAISGIAISLATLYSILLYLNIVQTDFLILDTFATFLPIEQQNGPRIMFHSNATGVTKDAFPEAVVWIFYALYFLWFYLGFKSLRNVMAPEEPTPMRKPATYLYIRVGGLLVFVSAGMMLFFFIMIPLDTVAIGDALGAASDQQDKEAVVYGYMATSNARFSYFSDSLCNPDRISAEQVPPRDVDNLSAIDALVSSISSADVTQQDVIQMCQSREVVGSGIIFGFVNLSTWLFLVAIFMVCLVQPRKSAYWEYGAGG